MATLLDGRKLASTIERRLAAVIETAQPRAGRPPGLAVLRVGHDPASGVYVANKEKACRRVGINSLGNHLPEGTTPEAVLKQIQRLNADQQVDGILLQLPLPGGIDEVPLLAAIDPEKDPDGLHTLNLGRLLKGESGPRSCTPAGVMALLADAGVELAGRRAVVVGRSILVGKPMAMMLQAADATVSVAHSRTRDLADLTRQAEVLVVAAGRPRMLGAEHIREISIWATDGLRPDLTVLLDLGPTPALSRSTDPADRLESEPMDFHERVREAFLTFAGSDPDRYLVLDASRERHDLHEQVRTSVGALLAERSPR